MDWVPTVSEWQGPTYLRIVDALEDNDDVQDVYGNFDISDELMEAVG